MWIGLDPGPTRLLRGLRDLAGLTTTGRLDGDHHAVNAQKI
jgi:hypothetical protein